METERERRREQIRVAIPLFVDAEDALREVVGTVVCTEELGEAHVAILAEALRIVREARDRMTAEFRDLA